MPEIELGKVTFPDGDWVQFPTVPTHRQAKEVMRAVSAATAGGADAVMDAMAPTIASLATLGELTSEVTHQRIAFPFTAEALDEVSNEKLGELFAAALAIRGLIPNLPRPK